MTVRELEDKVWDQDRIRIVIREHSSAQMSPYRYSNAAQENWRITQFLRNRVHPLIESREVVVLAGNGEVPHGRTLLRTLRESYN